MDDVEMIEKNLQDEDDLKRQRIESYKNALKYYRSRSLSLDILLASKQAQPLSDEIVSYGALIENTKGIHNGITLLQSLKECIKLIQNSVTCNQIDQSADFEFKKEIIDKINGIIYFSKSIMNLYDKNLGELDIIEKKKNYIAALDNYGKHLNDLKNQKDNLSKEDLQALEKAELHVYKINLIRSMKEVLIGFSSVYCPDILHQIEKFRNPVRRNLTVDDFTETWDVGLNFVTESQKESM